MSFHGICDDCGERIGYECRCDVIRELSARVKLLESALRRLDLEMRHELTAKGASIEAVEADTGISMAKAALAATEGK